MDESEILLMGEIAKRSLVRRSELVTALGASKEAVESVLKNLIAKGFVISVAPAGETSYALTQKGIKAIGETQ